jgi:hypothetical protein
MIKHIPIGLIMLFSQSLLFGQTADQQEDFAKVSGKIYSNFNYGLNSENPSTAFALQRAYFGYEKSLGEHFSANVKLDVGSPDDISEFSRLRRYAYFKNAGITYRNNKLTAWFGLFDMLQFKVQEKFWGYRYLYRSYMDEYRIGPSADLGAGVRYSFTDFLDTDIIISNGEGYSSPQRDDTYKIGVGNTITPLPNLTLRTYYALFAREVPQMTISGFAGYRASSFRIGFEYNHQHNYKFNQNRDRYGYSCYATYEINDQFEVFLRYDQIYSNIVDEQTIPWNLPNDGSAIIGGLQYSPVKNINIALDYQDWVEYANNGNKNQIIYLHLEANF